MHCVHGHKNTSDILQSIYENAFRMGLRDNFYGQNANVLCAPYIINSTMCKVTQKHSSAIHSTACN